ncbi:hypothetical protein DMB66_18500, partial [Actinoplanes sp. ATCC 53533]|uniref:DUF2971 domain-containing protein n=1 Tax=Actinoplanes sp. ATCC 53533 TaxID=1288362 RepID=UPI001002D957
RYGDRHRGVCLVFDAETLGAEFSEASDTWVRANSVSSFVDVEYHDAPLQVPLEGEFDHLDSLRTALGRLLNARTIAALYGRKSTVWQHERETRLVQVRFDPPELELDNPLYLDVPRSLKAIVLGTEFGDTTSVLRYLAQFDEPRPELFRCVWDGGVPHLRR